LVSEAENAPNAEKSNLDEENYAIIAENVMQSLAATPQYINEVEKLTHRQADPELNKITACRLNRICSLQETMSNN